MVHKQQSKGKEPAKWKKAERVSRTYLALHNSNNSSKASVASVACGNPTRITLVAHGNCSYKVLVPMATTTGRQVTNHRLPGAPGHSMGWQARPTLKSILGGLTTSTYQAVGRRQPSPPNV